MYNTKQKSKAYKKQLSQLKTQVPGKTRQFQPDLWTQ